MANKVKNVKIITDEGQELGSFPIGANAENIETNEHKNLQIKVNEFNNNKTEVETARGRYQNLNSRLNNLDSEFEKRKPYIFNTFADMKKADLKAGDVCRTLGYYEVNDGGAAEYNIIAVAANLMYQINLNNGLYAELVPKNNTINVLQAGAKNDKSFDNYVILNKIFNSSYNIYLPKGDYICTGSIICDKPKKIYGHGNIIFNNAVGNGLLVGDSVQLQDLSFNAIDPFRGVILSYNGSLGTRTYPSSSRFEHLRISSNTSENIECMFDFNPWKNYGVVVDDVIIGNISDTRKANYGFRSINKDWVNSIMINKLIIDIYGTCPFYADNQSIAGGSGRDWNLTNVIVQARDVDYDQAFHFKNMSYITLINCYLWDGKDGKYKNGEVVFDKVAYKSLTGCSDEFYNATQINIPKYREEINGYRSYYNNYQYTPLMKSFITGTDDKIYPLLFPTLKFVDALNEIEIFTRYTYKHSNGMYFNAKTRGLSKYDAFYARDLIINMNVWDETPIVYFLELYEEGTVIWVKGNAELFIKASCGGIPRFCTNETLTKVITGERILMSPKLKSGNDPMTQTEIPKYFYDKTVINTWLI